MARSACALLVLLCANFATAEKEAAGANPIRKIVTLMQNMQKEIEQEGAKEKELFDKFMCFCSGNNGELTKAATDARAQIEELTSKMQSEEAQKVQTAQELVDHKNDREGAKADLEEATMLREKENGEYEAMVADSKTNIAAMASAIPALEKGMGGASLLQTPGGDKLRKLVASYPNVDPVDRKNVVAFLEENGDYVPQSGQIVGILKAMKDDMEANLKEAISEEEKAVAGYADLKSSKEKEVEVASEAIETKTTRSGELAVSVVQTKDALEDTNKELADTEKFIHQLDTECATKEKEWAERSALRAEEIKAISEAISILNDDDALDVFKKAVPSALVQDQVGFLQRSNVMASKVQKVQTILATANSKFPSQHMQLLLFTVNSKLKLNGKGKTQGMAGVIKMIDDMVVLLKKDQDSDDTQRTFCEDEFDKKGDSQKASQEKLSQVVASIDEATDAISSLADELAAHAQEIKDLDKAVAEATEQRKEEHETYLQSAQLNEAAVQLIGKAKNRLNKFYNPTLYKAPPKQEMDMEGKIVEAGGGLGFAQIRSHDSSDVAPGKAPETFGAYEKKGEKSAGVMGLMDMMVKELETDMKDATYEEKTAQEDYQKLMQDSQNSRAASAQSITTKESQKAEMEGHLQMLKESKTATDEDLSIVATAIQDLHVSCDFLIQNYDLRKEARANEGESLKNAKAILSGANFGF